MLQIFRELEFVTITNGKLNEVKQPAHRQITDAPSYQKRQQQIETEKQLLYSETADLQSLLTSLITQD